MNLPWLETLVKEGHVRPQVREMIYADCEYLLKTAKTKAQAIREAELRVEQAFDRFGARAKEIYEKNKTLVVGASAFLGNMAGQKVTNWFRGKAHTKEQIATITAVKNTIKAHPAFAADPAKAEVRYLELVKIAPALAANPHIAIPLVKEKLNSGFSAMDIQSLAIIQSNYQPNAGAQRGMTDTILRSQMPFPKVAAEENQGRSLEKIGDTLATITHMYKEAGVSFNTLGRAAQNALVLSAIPVLGGVGVGAVKHMMGTRNKQELQTKLESSFNRAIQLSDPEKDSLKQNKEKARQAFQILAHFSPHVALEPHAAKSFMAKLVEYDSKVQVDDIKNLSEIQRNYDSSKSGPAFFEGLAAGSKALGLESSLKSSLSGIGEPLSEDLKDLVRKDLKA